MQCTSVMFDNMDDTCRQEIDRVRKTRHQISKEGRGSNRWPLYLPCVSHVWFSSLGRLLFVRSVTRTNQSLSGLVWPSPLNINHADRPLQLCEVHSLVNQQHPSVHYASLYFRLLVRVLPRNIEYDPATLHLFSSHHRCCAFTRRWVEVWYLIFLP